MLQTKHMGENVGYIFQNRMQFISP